ncbi:MAG: class B sortase [Clostridiales bacterium]|nr:class B sortase [Clostridiales bacterium]
MFKKRNRIRKVLIVILSAILLYSGINIGIYLYDGYSNTVLNKNLSEEYHKFGDAGSIDKMDSSDPNLHGQYAGRFESLLDINKDVVGWIKIAGTKIDYPVVQADNNRFYLNHNVERKKSSHGAIFMDYRNTGDRDFNTVIYGHSLKDGTMFGSLLNYKDPAFCLKHKTIEYDSLEQSMKWRIFSVYIFHQGSDFIQVYFDSDEEYARYLNIISRNSIYETGIEVTKGDKILTLVTCSYEFNDARLVICAKRI